VTIKQEQTSALHGDRRRRQWTLFLSILIVAVAVLFAVPNVRHLVLRAAGWALVASDPEEPADIIVIAVDAGSAGVLEASDLIHRGIATRVAVFAESPDPLQPEFAKRGLPQSNQAARSIRLLNALGVTATEEISPIPSGTEEEAQILPRWCDQNGFQTIIFVSTPDHSRRTRRALHRSMSGHKTRVLVRYSTYSSFNPDSWWLTRDSVRTELIESEKLLLDVLRHPLSGY